MEEFYKEHRKHLVKEISGFRSIDDFFKIHNTFKDFLFDYCFGDIK